jgi:cytochrome c oxidase assembly factor CtaG
MQDPTLSHVLRSWSWQPAILLGLGTVAAGYTFAFYHFRHHGWLDRLARRDLLKRSHPWFFASGLAVLILALLSPIDALAELLFWAHMVQHLLLLMVAPPLILLGLPSPLIRWLVLEARLRGVLDWLTNPLLAFGLFNVNLWLWHVPSLYESALRDPLIHDLEHALFFYTAVFFWWRVIDPTRGWFPLWQWAPAKWIYLLVAAPPSYILGSILWASNRVLYDYYTQIPRLWGVPAITDQQIGGLLMWVQGWMFMMVSLFVFYFKYDPETETV